MNTGVCNIRSSKGFNDDDEQAAQTEYRSLAHFTRAPPGEDLWDLNNFPKIYLEFRAYFEA